MYKHCLVTQNLLQNTSISEKMSASFRLANHVADSRRCIVGFRLRTISLSKKCFEDIRRRVANLSCNSHKVLLRFFLSTYWEKRENRCKRTHSVHCIYKHTLCTNTYIYIFILYNHTSSMYTKDCTHTVYTHSHPQHYSTCMISQHLYFCLVV